MVVVPWSVIIPEPGLCPITDDVSEIKPKGGYYRAIQIGHGISVVSLDTGRFEVLGWGTDCTATLTAGERVHNTNFSSKNGKIYS